MRIRLKAFVILSVFAGLSVSAQLFNISVVSGQIMSKVEMTEFIEGICNPNEVYGLFDSYDGQIGAKCSLTRKQIEALLNEKVDFLAKNPKYKDKGMAGCYINCNGIVLEWDISIKTKNPELDSQILEVFKSLSNWTSGTLNGKNVDSRLLFAYKIKKGRLIFD